MSAGITIYSALEKTNLKAGQWLVLPGAGGGLGHMYAFSCSFLPWCGIEGLRSNLPRMEIFFGQAKVRADADRFSCVSGIQIAAKKGYKVIAIDT